MIDDKKTIEMFGYTADDLKPKSGMKIVVVCDDCGDERILRKIDYVNLKHNGLCHSCAHKGILHSLETIVKMREVHKRENLSEETLIRMAAAQVHLGRMHGADNPNWKGGITDENQRFYHSPEYNDWRIYVFKRDKFVCQECGNIGGNLNAHHILPYRDWRDPQYSLNTSNGITLCRDCHIETYGNEYEFFSKYFDLANGITQLHI